MHRLLQSCVRSAGAAGALIAAAWCAPSQVCACVDASHFRAAHGAQHVYVADEARFNEKCARLKAGGADALQLLVDFDRTATTYWRDRQRGVKAESAYGVIELYQSPEVKRQAHAMLEHYLPIETSHTLTREEKIPHMQEWYERANALLAASGFRRDSIPPAVVHSEIRLRPGVMDVMRLCELARVPFVLFSGGIGNVLEEVLRQAFAAESAPGTDGQGTIVQRNADGVPHNVFIVSNWMRFDEAGVITSMSTPVVHMFNKDESHVRHLPVYDELRRRKNVLLIGDSLGDVTMADGLPHDTVLRVGLLHDKVDLLLPQYMAAFDVVLVDDAPLTAVVDLVRSIVKARE